MRKTVVGVLLAGAMVAGTGIAQAHILLVDGRDGGRTGPDGQTIQVGGVIRCTEGHTFNIRVRVRQAEAKANGIARGACQGVQQQWSVVADAVGGTFHEGPAALDGRANTRLGGDVHGDVRWSEKIHVTEGP
ncbi:MAG: hypothetical protein HY658_14795 [Actinobacteria bacterium]|nr:hypothetical protein [Actinomycetota bacterium]